MNKKRRGHGRTYHAALAQTLADKSNRRLLLLAGTVAEHSPNPQLQGTNSMSRILTAATLRGKGACSKQLTLFRQLTGEQVEVTVELCVKHAPDFNWDWVAYNLLTAPALAEYARVMTPALAEYARVMNIARVEYNRVADAALAEYARVRAAAWAEYARVTAPARVEYDRVRAAAWARAYISDAE
jgi:cell division septum initiation protein DivIVA